MPISKLSRELNNGENVDEIITFLEKHYTNYFDFPQLDILWKPVSFQTGPYIYLSLIEVIW